VSGVTSWASELPSGHNPFWLKDEALADLGLHAGQAVGVDTRREPVDGDLVLAEIELDDLADRLVRRFQPLPGDDLVRLRAAGPGYPDLTLASDQLLVLGVVCSRIRFEAVAGGPPRAIETPL
jgi:SOS-response transcriptional repressor LexA